MKKFLLFLLMTTPLFTWAQVDDMYYVPKKEKKVLHVKSAEEVYFADDNTAIDEDSLTYIGDENEGYYTNDLYDVMDDYTYSNRIIRFQSPRRMYANDIYWDLMYGCGVNDWYVYDNGYTLYIYPTGNNPYFMSPGYYHWMNRWNWNSCYYDYYYPYYSWHNYHPYYGWHNYHHHWHTPVASHKPWKPKYRENIPTNGSVARQTRQAVPTMAGNPRREQSARTTANAGNPRREQSARTTANAGNPRREQSARTTANAGNPRREQSARTTANTNNPRRQQSDKTTANSARRQQSARTANTSNTKQRREQKARTSVNSSNAKRSTTSNSESTSARRSSSNSSSSGYSRPSSTSVSRSSRGSSNSNSNSSGSRSGGSSSRSGGGARSGGSRR